MATIRLRGRFPASTQVELHERVSDFFTPGQLGSPVAKGKTDKNSEVSFDALDPGAAFWVVDEGRTRGIAVTAKDAPPPKPSSKPLGSAAPGEDTSQNVKIVTGARGTKNVEPPPGFGHKSVGQPSDKPEAAPFLSQEDSRDLPQRSSTITGEAHPVEVEAPKQKKSAAKSATKSTAKKGK